MTYDTVELMNESWLEAADVRLCDSGPAWWEILFLAVFDGDADEVDFCDGVLVVEGLDLCPAEVGSVVGWFEDVGCGCACCPFVSTLVLPILIRIYLPVSYPPGS